VALFVGVVGVQSCKSKKWEMKDDTVYSGGAQTKDGLYITHGEVLKLAEKMPQFDGDMMAYMVNNVKYPEEAREKKVQGTVYVQFVVDPTGAIVNPKVVESESGLLSVEALRAVNNMPKWIPGENGGQKVAVMMTLPVSFKLDF
jgi:TonB family protein